MTSSIQDASTFWHPLGASADWDFPDDQQTGSDPSDIVGNATSPAFYHAFYDGGTDSATNATDGEIGFRVRMGGSNLNKGAPQPFDNFLFIGIDVGHVAAGETDADPSKIDIFVGLDTKNNTNPTIGFYDPGTGANTGPSTTTIGNVISVAGANPVTPAPVVVGGNFDWNLARNLDSGITSALDQNTANDANVDGGKDKNNLDADDYFLSFKFDLIELKNALIELGIADFDDRTTMAYIMGTSEQSNAFNQDINGVNGLNDPRTWDELGAITGSSGPQAIPEPAAYAALFGLLALGFAANRRRQR